MICPCPPKNFRLAASATQFAKCILLHAYSHTTAIAQLRKNKKNKQNLIAYLLSWHKSIFGKKLRTIVLKLKFLKKLRTANLDSEFTGPYKKSILNEQLN